MYVVLPAGLGHYLLQTLYSPKGIVSLIFLGCISLAVTLSCTYIFGIKSDERLWVKTKIKSIIHL